jgi:ABC-2 type transport system permease protein
VTGPADERLGPARFARGVRLIFARELAASFDTKIAYVYTVSFVLLANAIFMNDFFLVGTVDMSRYFELLPLLLPFFLPAITMRLWAEERKQRTIELLLTLPIAREQAILGKYLAAYALYALLLLGSLPIVVMLCVLGDPDLGRIAAGYVGLGLLGAQFLAFGGFFSALTADQVVAFVVSALFGYFLVLSGDERVVAVLDGLAPRLSGGTLLRDTVSVLPHVEATRRGALDLATFVYFLGTTAVFLWGTARVLERSRA